MKTVVAQWENQISSLRRVAFDTNALIYFDKAEIFFRDTHNLAIRAVDRVIARRAAEVRARTRLEPLDSIIVATALEERCDAIIGNDSIIASRPTGIPYIYLDDYV